VVAIKGSTPSDRTVCKVMQRSLWIRRSPIHLDAVHEAYVEMAASGIVTEAQRKVFNRVSERLLHTAGAQAITLGRDRSRLQ
jgi:hypothetical protein